MSVFFKILLFTILFYLLFSMVKNAFLPRKKERPKQQGVRIFKKGKIEEPKMDTSDAETIEYEEIKEPKDLKD